MVVHILNNAEKLSYQEGEDWDVTDVKGENPSEKWKNTEILTGCILFKVTLSAYRNNTIGKRKMHSTWITAIPYELFKVYLFLQLQK